MEIARVLFRVGLQVMVIIVLAGCMEALKTDGLDDPNRSGWPRLKASPAPLAYGSNSFASLLPVTPLSQTSAPSHEPREISTPLFTPMAVSISPSPTAIPPSPTAKATVSMVPPTAIAPVTAISPTPHVVIALPTVPTRTSQELWRSQQHDRVVFDTLRPYRTLGSVLWWYDPINQHHVGLGSFSGPFVAQAQFRLELNGQMVDALEVPYQVDQSYGVQALSPALLDRIHAAGYDEWIDTYVILTAEVQSLN